jgi:hypothetical protein
LSKKRKRAWPQRRTLDEELGLDHPIVIRDQTGIYQKTIVDERPPRRPVAEPEPSRLSPGAILAIIVAVLVLAGIVLVLK